MPVTAPDSMIDRAFLSSVSDLRPSGSVPSLILSRCSIWKHYQTTWGHGTVSATERYVSDSAAEQKREEDRAAGIAEDRQGR